MTLSGIYKFTYGRFIGENWLHQSVYSPSLIGIGAAVAYHIELYTGTRDSAPARLGTRVECVCLYRRVYSGRREADLVMSSVIRVQWPIGTAASR